MANQPTPPWRNGTAPVSTDREDLGSAVEVTLLKASSKQKPRPKSGQLSVDTPCLRFGHPDAEPPRLFVVSVCDGIGSGLVALDKYTDVVGIACERNPHLRAFVAGKWPGVKTSALIEDLKGDELMQQASAHGAAVILLIGGPPCPPFSALSSAPKGFADERSAPLREYKRIRDTLQELCKPAGITFLWLLEEVGSMSASHRQEISELLGAEPVLLHAADYGYIHRARLYWGLQLDALTSAKPTRQEGMVMEVFPPGRAAEGLHVIRWCGRADPAEWKPDDGFTWRYRQEVGVTACMVPGTKFAPSYPTGRFLALTTIFPHPADRPPKGTKDPDVYQRFIDDSRRRPLFQYMRGNMVWKENAVRPLNAEESEELMGLPRSYTGTLQPNTGQTQDDARLSAIGNTFHVPSIVLLLALLFNPLSPADACAHDLSTRAYMLDAPQCDEWEEKYASGSIWTQATATQCSNTGGNILREAISLFDATLLGEECESMANRAAAKLDKLPLSQLQVFEAFLTTTGAPPTATGPDIQALWAKSPMHCAVEKQHRPSMSAIAPDGLLPRGQGPDLHVEMAKQLDHPFATDPPLERDLLFAVEANVRLGPNIRTHRKKRLRIFERIADATSELDDALRQKRPVSIKGIPGPAPMFVAILVVLFKWPDRRLPQCLATGFEIARCIPPADVFRPCEPKRVGEKDQLPLQGEILGPSAAEFVDELESMKKTGKQAQVIYDLTMQEVREGLAEPMVDRAAMDRRFGRGRWRPLPRHVIWQSGKWRPIDDGKRSKTNAFTTMCESTVSIPPEFLLVLLRAVALAFTRLTGDLPAWAVGLRFATEDWWKGFRQVAPSERDRGLAVVALQDPTSGKWLYSVLNGLPFGLGAAFNQFSRLPQLISAIARRGLYLLSGHYVDDNVLLEVGHVGGDAQRSFCRLVEMMGILLSPSKKQPTTTMAGFLGHDHDLTRIIADGAAIYSPKAATREKMEELIEQAFARQQLSSGAAAKLRGVANWLDTGLAGRCCRGALTALTARQYWERATHLTQNMSDSLTYLLAAARCAPARSVQLIPEARAPVLVYTDASDEDGRARMGAIVYRPGHKPHAMMLDATPEIRASWGPQTTIINQAELAAALMVAATVPELLRGMDIIWFIDNSSAESALVKAGSPTETMCRQALYATAMLAGLGCRVWFEHVPSKDNIADVLSRDAKDDPMVRAMIESGQWLWVDARMPALEGPLDFERLWGGSESNA